MSNHLQSILNQWWPKRGACDWVLASVVRVQGSSYRKPGAMMLFSDSGEMLGMVSGGCVERSLLILVKRVLTEGIGRTIEIDASSVDAAAWQLGCGGVVTINLQPVTAKTHYQQLDKLHAALVLGNSGVYRLALDPISDNQFDNKALALRSAKQRIDGQFLAVHVRPPWQLVIFGAGQDALPLLAMAKQLGWLVSMVEPRPSFALAASFSGADRLLRLEPEHPDVRALMAKADGIVLMSHNLSWDARALKVALQSSARYLGLLGPAHRKLRVLTEAGVNDDPRLYGPMGLDLGGELPESVALSVLAQCHQVFECTANEEATKGCETEGRHAKSAALSVIHNDEITR